MKELFTGIYKKVAGFFQTPEKENLKEVACNRLKFVLMQDRTNLNPYLLERMRSEMIDVLSKYVEMDKEALELSFEQEGESMALMLSIPVIRAKEEEEIQALIKEEEEAKAAREAAKAEEEESEEEESEEEESEEEESEEEESEEAEEAFEEDATETVDTESEDVEDEEVYTCGDDDDDDDESDDVDLEYVEEITPAKKSKKGK